MERVRWILHRKSRKDENHQMIFKVLSSIFGIIVLTMNGCVVADDSSKSLSFKQQYHVVGEDGQREKNFSEALNKQDEAWTFIHQGTHFYDKHEFNQAIEFYKKALKSSDLRHPTEWVARGLLGKCYEETKQYSLALDEINWQISQGPRKDVKEKLNIRKQNIEKRLANNRQK